MDSNDILQLFDRHHSNNAGFCRHYLTLYSMVLGMESQNVFEFGSGFSTKTILMALEKTGGKLTTCDLRPLSETSIFYDMNDLKKYTTWKYLQKRSVDAYNDYKNEVFDFVLHDGSHTIPVVKQDMKNIIPRMKKGSLFLLHDVSHPTENYNLVEAIESLTWCKTKCVILPYGYGLAVITIEEDFGHGSIDIKWRKSE